MMVGETFGFIDHENAFDIALPVPTLIPNKKQYICKCVNKYEIPHSLCYGTYPQNVHHP